MRRLFAVDLGGTRVKAGSLDADRPGTEGVLALGYDGTLAGAREAISAAARQVAPDGCELAAVAVPGLVAGDRVVALPGKLDGIVGFDLGGFVGGLVGAPCRVVNDAVAYGLGEAVHGAGAGADRVVVVTIGTGVGVAVLEGGRPLGSGPLGAGQLGGQIPVADDPAGPADTSGRRGTIEAWCRADRILASVREAGGSAADIPAAYAAARAGDPAAVAGLEAYRARLARGLVALAMAHAPSALVVGGGPLGPGSPLLDGVEAAVRAQLWPGQSLSVRPAELGDGAALAGLAALWAR